jgi:hypothetical protein
MAREPLTPTENPFAGLDLWFAVKPRASSTQLWDAWHLAQVQAQIALVAWREAGPGIAERAHAVYMAALDREEQAALGLALKLKPRAGRRLRDQALARASRGALRVAAA